MIAEVRLSVLNDPIFGLEISAFVTFMSHWPLHFPSFLFIFEDSSMKTDFSQTNLDYWTFCLSSYFCIFFF